MKKQLLFILGILCAANNLLAQETSTHRITGTVLSARDDTPLAGVTVKLQNSMKGAITDADGHFSLPDVVKGATLIVSSIGYTQREVLVDDTTVFIIRLQPAENLLDETVIMGYGTTTQRLNTGNISTITAKEIAQQPVTNVLAAMSGRAPGVYVQTQNGLPGGDIKIQIRGKNSIGAGNEPLFIVDGVPYPSVPLNNLNTSLTGASGYTSPLNSINPGDIQSIEILKDADATAIYGSRGSNGVVLITTKKGRMGKTSLNVNIYKGFSKLNMQGHYLNLSQYLQLRREAFKNDGVAPTIATAPDLLVWDTTRSTDWQKYLFGGSDQLTQVQASLSGGSENNHFLLSSNFRETGTIYIGDFHYVRAGVHFNFKHRSRNKKIILNFTVDYIADKNNLPKLSLLSSLSLPPNFPLYDSVGKLNWNGGNNPLAVLKQTNKAQTDNLIANTTLQYAIIKGLKFKASLGFNKLTLSELSTTPKASQVPSSYMNNSADFGDMSVLSYIIEPQINYIKSIGKGNLTALLGGTWQNTLNQSTYIKAVNYSNEELLEALGAAGDISYINDRYTKYKYLSVFARVNYNWQNKYIINGSFRRDGSSRFGPGKQYGNFGAVGIAWIFSDETFVKDNLPFLSYGKLRGSYGLTGSDQITDYQYLSSYGSGRTYNGIATLKPTRIANPDYSWETNKKLEAAIELGFIKNRILLTTAWYRNRSSNQLVSYPLPTQSGFSSYQANLPALVENSGWEFGLNTTNISSDNLNWQTSFNITFSRNELISFPGIEGSSYAFSYEVGKSLSVKKGYVYTGVDPQTGVGQFKDINKDGKINSDDRMAFGKENPDFYGGFNNTVSYKGIELSVFFQFAKQQNNTLIESMAGMNNYLDVVLNRWRNPGDVTRIQKPTAIPGSPAYSSIFNMGFSSATFSDASYIRLKNISLGYRLKSNWLNTIGAEGCRIYIEAENILTWAANSDYRLDPETVASSIPPLKTYVLGIKLTF